jgi:hypothetical protein
LELPLNLPVAIEEKYAVVKHQIPPVKVKVSPKIKITGAIYLAYLGIKMIISKNEAK